MNITQAILKEKKLMSLKKNPIKYGLGLMKEGHSAIKVLVSQRKKERNK